MNDLRGIAAERRRCKIGWLLGSDNHGFILCWQGKLDGKLLH